jgi:DNA repair exonuclease SbcCD ATPase subunit
MITFQKIRWKNFLSTGNAFTEVDLLRHNTTLITGENGAGKTTLLDALTFVLFGKPYRNINIPQLVNSINEKECLVEIEFSVGGNEFVVRRGIAPKVFEIHKNGKLVDVCANAKDYQKMLEEQILKLNLKSFCQVVILGSTNYVPFMRLAAADRRTIVESILDISVFSTMNVLLKERQTSLKDRLREVESGMNLIREKIDLQKKFIQSVKQQSESLIEEKEAAIASAQAEEAALEAEIVALQEEVDRLLGTVEDRRKALPKSASKLHSLQSQIGNNIRVLQNEISFYEKNSTCPTCQQEISEDHKCSEMSAKESKLQEMQKGLEEIQSKIGEVEAAIADVDSVLQTVKERQSKIHSTTSSKRASEKHIAQLRKEIDRIVADKSSEEAEAQKLQKMESMEKEICKNRNDMVETSSVYSVASSLLKDSGIKKKIVSHYLPIINKTINAYLTRMNFFVSFELDDNFTEKIKSRHRDEFTYDSFSEGEKRRIDLALLFAWRAIAQQKNSVNCNLLILDEILDGSLDDNATDAFLDILKTLNTSVRVFVISHKNPEALGDKFKNRIVFKKKNNFSMLTEYV